MERDKNLDRVLTAIHDRIPHMNRYLLKGYREQQTHRIPEFIATIFREAMTFLKGRVVFKSYRILTPEERATLELREHTATYSITECVLVEYVFEFDQEIIKTHIYVPYLNSDGSFVIDDKQYVLQLAITEQVFSRINEGLIVRLIRDRIKITRDKDYIAVSATSDRTYRDLVVTIYAYHPTGGASKKKCDTTIIHYLLARYGFYSVIRMFCFYEDEIGVVDTIADDRDQYEYFKAAKDEDGRDPVYLKVKHTCMQDTVKRRFVVNLLYTLTYFSFQSAQALVSDTLVYRYMLGLLIRTENDAELARGHADAHLESLDFYLDPINKARFIKFGIIIGDFYDLMRYIFIEIGRIMATTTHQNLYHCRFDVIEGIMVNTIAKTIFKKVYNTTTGSKLTPKSVRKLLKVSPQLLLHLHDTDNVVVSPPRHNDNAATAYLLNKLRSGPKATNLRAPELRFHPSLAVVESLVTISHQNPGNAGGVNPYLSIDEDGVILRPDYAEDIDAIIPYLPFK